MALNIALLGPGDVVATAGKGFWIGWIKFQALLTGKPALVNHVVVVSHRDASGTLWGIEARPGGVGWVDMSTWDKKAYAVSNHDQPKTEQQRAKIVESAAQLLGTEYDYFSLVKIAMETLGLNALWHKEFPDDVVPVHIQCAALADFVYEEIGLDSPGGAGRTRFTTPGDWHEFIELREWEI